MIVMSWCPWYHSQLVARVAQVVDRAERPLSPVEQPSPLHSDAPPSPQLTGYRERHSSIIRKSLAWSWWQLHKMVQNYANSVGGCFG